jgi:hypothetical protein
MRGRLARSNGAATKPHEATRATTRRRDCSVAMACCARLCGGRCGGPSAAQVERASSLPIQIAFEPLGAGLAGLVTAGAVQAATELPEVVDVGGEERPDTGREEQPDH